MNLVIGSQHWQKVSNYLVKNNLPLLEKTYSEDTVLETSDVPETVYANIYDGSRPVATAEFIKENTATARIRGIHILKEHHGRNLESLIIRGLEDYAKEKGLSYLILLVEMNTIAMYQELGYEVHSEVYSEDGTPCRKMKRALYPSMS